MIQINSFLKQKQTYSYQKQTYGYWRGNVGGGTNQELRMNIHILLCTDQWPAWHTVHHRERNLAFCDNLHKKES